VAEEEVESGDIDEEWVLQGPTKKASRLASTS